jgi:hypothetical protein
MIRSTKMIEERTETSFLFLGAMQYKIYNIKIIITMFVATLALEVQLFESFFCCFFNEIFKVGLHPKYDSKYSIWSNFWKSAPRPSKAPSTHFYYFFFPFLATSNRPQLLLQHNNNNIIISIHSIIAVVYCS